MKRRKAKKQAKPKKPRLLLLRGQDVQDPQKLAAFFEQLTGRKITPEELELARKRLAKQ